jgi:hypothetical protein
MDGITDQRALVMALLDDAGDAWNCVVTANGLCNTERSIGFSAAKLNDLRNRLLNDLNRAMHMFQQSEDILRRAMLERGERLRKASTKQIALIHVAARTLGLGEEDYRNIIIHVGRVNSAADADRLGVDLMMHFFKRIGFQPSKAKLAPTRETFGRRAAMATPAQVDLIRQLWSEYVGDLGGKSDEDLNAWLEKSYHVSALRFVDSATAGKAITGLKRMVARKSGKMAG